jgi:hypothetical protein
VRTLWNRPDRAALVERLARLTAETPALWGKFTAPRMLAHVNDALRMSTGELKTSLKKTPLRFPIVKQIAVYLAPWPRGVPTVPELLASGERAQWEAERAVFPDLLDVFANRPLDAAFPLHPAFWRLSRRAWGRQQWRHVDHHFRQFGA